MNIKSILKWLLAIALGVAIYFYFSSKEFKYSNEATQLREIKDLAGRTVKIKTSINRIILLRSKDIYELAPLLEDELPKKLIAWGPDLEADDKEAYEKFTDRYPALKTIPKTGSVYNDALNIEQLIALSPDLIIADRFLIDRGYKYVSKLEESGLPVVYLNGSNDPIHGSQQGMELLGQVLEKEQKANEIVSYVNAQFDSIFSKLDNYSGSIPSVYLEQGYTGPHTFGSTYGSTGNPKEYTSWGMVLHWLKVKNIADGIVGKQEPINPEYILKTDPDVIVITGQNWIATPGAMRLGYYASCKESTALLKSYTSRPGWHDLKAVKNKEVFSVFHNTAVITCFAAVQTLAKDFYPSLFMNLNPEKNIKEFYQRFMPISYSGTWTVDLKEEIVH